MEGKHFHNGVGGEENHASMKERSRSPFGVSSVSLESSVYGAGRLLRLLRKPLPFWVRLVLGIVFITAAFGKILDPAAFAQTIYNYQILPGGLVNLAALILPWLELVLGVLLILGLWLPGAVTLANMLLLIFLGALVFNTIRGLDVDCGCFGAGSGSKATASIWYYLARDFVFLVMGGYLFLKVLLKREQNGMQGKEA